MALLPLMAAATSPLVRLVPGAWRVVVSARLAAHDWRRCSAVQPNETDATVWQFKQRCEKPLARALVLIGRERSCPSLPVISRIGQTHVIRVHTATRALHPLGDERAVREATHRWQIKTVDRPIVAGRDGARLGPSISCALGEAKCRLRAGVLDPAQKDAAIRQ